MPLSDSSKRRKEGNNSKAVLSCESLWHKRGPDSCLVCPRGGLVAMASYHAITKMEVVKGSVAAGERSS